MAISSSGNTLRSHDWLSSGPEAKRVEETLRLVVAELEAIKKHLGARITPRLLSLDQAAAYIGRTRRAVEHLVKANAFATVRYDDRVMVDRRDLDAWIDKSRF